MSDFDGVLGGFARGEVAAGRLEDGGQFRSVVVVGEDEQSRTTKLTQTSTGRSASCSMVRPSAGEPGAMVNRWKPSGSSRSRMPSDHGSGCTVRIGTRRIRATVGTRLP